MHAKLFCQAVNVAEVEACARSIAREADQWRIGHIASNDSVHELLLAIANGNIFDLCPSTAAGHFSVNAGCQRKMPVRLHL